MVQKYLKLLLIEENPEDARKVNELLAHFSPETIQMEWVDRLSVGLERLDEEAIDVLLLDLSLSESAGIDTLLEIQSHAPAVPIVVLTGIEDEELALRAVREGAQDYLLKGQLNGDVLLRSLRYAIERHKLTEALQELSRDCVTDLYNYHAFTLLAEHQMSVARRTKRGLCLFFISVRGLRHLTGRLGLRERYRALKKIARGLRASFRSSDIIARLRWDEFAVLTIDAAEDSAELLKSRLLTELEKVSETENGYKLSISVGAAQFDPENTFCLGQLLAMADQAMFEGNGSCTTHPASARTRAAAC